MLFLNIYIASYNGNVVKSNADDSGGENVAVAVGSTIAVVVVIVGLVLAAIFFRRRYTVRILFAIVSA